MLAQQMVLCKYRDTYSFSSKCDPVPFKLEVVNRGQLLMTVPAALPREHYRLTVKASDKVRMITLKLCSDACVGGGGLTRGAMRGAE